MSVLGFTAQAQKANNKNSSTIVLVHGAWSDATAWQAVVPLLKAQGHEVTKGMVRLPQGPLKQVGDYPITLDLNGDVTTIITVSVLGDTSN